MGVGMRSHSGVASTFFDALANSGINMLMISTSEIKISVAVNPDQGDEATRVAHQAFGLGSSLEVLIGTNSMRYKSTRGSSVSF